MSELLFVEPVQSDRENSPFAVTIGTGLMLCRRFDGKRVYIDDDAFREVLPALRRYVDTAVRRSLDGLDREGVSSAFDKHEEVVQDVMAKIIRELHRPYMDEWTPDRFAQAFKVWVMGAINLHWRHVSRGQPRISYVDLRTSSMDQPVESTVARQAVRVMSERIVDPRNLLPMICDFRKRWSLLSWPDRHILRAWAIDQRYAEIGRNIGVHTFTAIRYVERALGRLSGDLPCSHWDTGRCLATAVRRRGKILVVLPQGAHEWILDGVRIRVAGRYGEARVKPAEVSTSELIGLDGPPIGERLPAITSVRGVSLECLLEAGGDVRIVGPSFSMSPHALPS